MKTKKLLEALREEANSLRGWDSNTIDSSIANAFDNLANMIEGPKTYFKYAPDDTPEPVSARQHVANVDYPQLTDHHTPTLDSIPTVTMEWADADFVKQHLSVEAPGDVSDQSGHENQKHTLVLDYGNHAALAIEGTIDELIGLATKIVIKLNTVRGRNNGE